MFLLTTHLVNMKKTILTITQERHHAIKSAAKARGKTITELSSMLLDYALNKLETGALKLSDPCLIEKKGA